MAAGYLHVPAVVALLQGGANPEVKDRKGQSVLDLVDSLKGPMAGNPAGRLALEKVSEILIGALVRIRCQLRHSPRSCRVVGYGTLCAKVGHAEADGKC